MSFAMPLNMSSVALVHEETQSRLVSTLSILESYLQDRSQAELITELHSGLDQLSGTFMILQFHGATELAALLKDVIGLLVKGQVKLTESVLASIGHAIFVLPKYVDYCISQEHCYPVVLNAYINQLAISAKQPIRWEYQSLNLNLLSISCDETALDTAEQKKLQRLHHMYQVGLLGLYKEKNQQQYGRLMAHVCQRVQAIDSMKAAPWRLSELVLTAVSSGKLKLNYTRLRLFMALDGYLRQLSKGKAIEVSQEHANELVYLLSVVGSKSTVITEMLRQCGTVRLGWADSDYVEHFHNIVGPGRETIAVLSVSLREELLQARDILELVSQTGVMDEWPRLLQIITKTESILSFLGLKDMAKTLRRLVNDLTACGEGGGGDSDSLLEAASTLLYIESAVSVLKSLPSEAEEAKTVSQEGQNDVIANVLLQEATEIVVKEGISSMTLAKRAIASYVESDFDYSHVANLSKTLSAVAGFLNMLEYDAAASVLGQCNRFVLSLEHSGNDCDERKVQIEILADAMIGVEYYIAELAAGGAPNQDLLVIAEQGVAELFEVEA